MKRLLLFCCILVAMISCSDSEPKEQTFFVNVYTLYEESNPEIWGEPKEELAKKAFLYIFQNNGKEIDANKSLVSVIEDGKITYSDKNVSKTPIYATNFQSGVFNLENIPNGNYILWVTYMTEYGGKCYSSYKPIKVDYSYRGTMEKKVFHISPDDIGYRFFQEW